MRTISVSTKNRSVSLTVHNDEIGGLGRKAAPDEYPPSLMVDNN